MFGAETGPQLNGGRGVAQPQGLHVTVAFAGGDHPAGREYRVKGQEEFGVHKRRLVARSDTAPEAWTSITSQKLLSLALPPGHQRTAVRAVHCRTCLVSVHQRDAARTTQMAYACPAPPSLLGVVAPAPCCVVLDENAVNTS